jgi:hypothetical protein
MPRQLKQEFRQRAEGQMRPILLSAATIFTAAFDVIAARANNTAVSIPTVDIFFVAFPRQPLPL